MTHDGKVVSGLLVKENTNAMFLASAEGAMQAVAYTDIDRASYSNVSLMPEGYEKVLTPHEIADIVAYLKADVSRPLVPVNQPANERYFLCFGTESSSPGIFQTDERSGDSCLYGKCVRVRSH